MIKLKKHTKQSRNSMELKATTSAALKALRSIFPDWTKEGLDIESRDETSGEAFVDIEIIKETGDRGDALMSVSPHFLEPTQTALTRNTVRIKIRRRTLAVNKAEFICTVTFPYDTCLLEHRVTFPGTWNAFERFDVRSLAARALKYALGELLEAQPKPEVDTKQSR